MGRDAEEEIAKSLEGYYKSKYLFGRSANPRPHGAKATCYIWEKDAKAPSNLNNCSFCF
jgi:hypothetical protein